MGPVWKSAVGLFVVPFTDLMMLPYVLQPLKEHRKARTVYLSCTAISSAFFMLAFIRNMFILGPNLTYMQYFPSYIAVSLINVGEFIQRIEVAIGAVLFMGAYVKIAVYLYVAALGLCKGLGFGDYREFSAPTGLLIAALALFAFPNMQGDYHFATTVYPIYQIPFHFIIPVAVWLMAEWKLKKLKKEGRLPEPLPAADETPVTRQDGSVPQNPDSPAGSQP
jgi:spore germination protein KB